MKVIICGATGMIGKGVLLECLDDDRVVQVLTIGRSNMELEHPNLKQLVHKDFTDFTPIQNELNGYDACFFCLGISAAGLNEAEYKKVTYDYTMAAARTLHRLNPDMTFTYVSGQGTDSSEKGRMMWARVKGQTENDLVKVGFKKAIMFRPGIIIPLRGIKSRTKSYQFMYDYFGWLIKIIKAFWPNSVTDTTKIGRAMINAPEYGRDGSILNPKDINTLAKRGEVH